MVFRLIDRLSPNKEGMKSIVQGRSLSRRRAALGAFALALALAGCGVVTSSVSFAGARHQRRSASP
jgi:hypothetical protein